LYFSLVIIQYSSFIKRIFVMNNEVANADE